MGRGLFAPGGRGTASESPLFSLCAQKTVFRQRPQAICPFMGSASRSASGALSGMPEKARKQELSARCCHSLFCGAIAGRHGKVCCGADCPPHEKNGEKQPLSEKIFSDAENSASAQKCQQIKQMFPDEGKIVSFSEKSECTRISHKRTSVCAYLLIFRLHEI